MSKPGSIDIVQRLREAWPCDDNPCRFQDARNGCCCAEAADEIERLRVIREEKDHLLSALEQAISALRKIEAIETDTVSTSKGLSEARHIARTVLGIGVITEITP